MKKETVLSLVALVVLSSCATIFSGTKATVTVTSPHTNKADIYVDGATYGNMSLPAEIQIKRKHLPLEIMAKNNELEGSVTVKKKFNPVSIVNLTIWPGWITDWATGAIKKPDSTTYSILMHPRNTINSDNTPDLIVLESSLQQPQPQQNQQPQQSQQIQPQPIVQQSLHQSGESKGTPKPIRNNSSDVDTNIPQAKSAMENTFVLIIANEKYQFLDDVSYATHDGEVFKEYCIKTLGVPEKQVRYCPNASYGIIFGGVDWLRYALESFDNSRGIVYYCGHGIPDEKTKEAYIIPVDGKGTNMTTCYSLDNLYKTLAATNADNVTYFLDACFTGANKEGSMLIPARGVACKPKKEILQGKTIVFSASSGDETAMTYEEKGHGLFTYYLLKKLQETKGDVSYEELASYVSEKVRKDAFLMNEKPQNPVVATSPEANNTWKKLRLK